MTEITEQLSGVVERVTYHNPDNGWSVLRVAPTGSPFTIETVTVHQTQVFAGATMDFFGNWTVHSQFGRQFKAIKAIEKKPATTAALEKYLGSGLIKGVGPKTARKIVTYFGHDTLEIFENQIERLTEVQGIALKKLKTIEEAWNEHKNVRDVMIFLQGHGISTLFAVRIYKEYGDKAIEIVSENPYRLAMDFYGIGFFSADKIALSIGIAPDGQPRLIAAIRHALDAAREDGHCFLTYEQIKKNVSELLQLQLTDNRLSSVLDIMAGEDLFRLRIYEVEGHPPIHCYYAKKLYYDENYVASRLSKMAAVKENIAADLDAWVDRYCNREKLNLSREQRNAVKRAVVNKVSVLTGGPGCGKTTTTLAIVSLFESLHLRVMLAAPTGRAAQRMSEVTGREAKTLHRLLGWKNGAFEKNEQQPLCCDVLIVDECSMLDISLMASMLKALPQNGQLLLVGDKDQLPSVGAGNVLRDIIASQKIVVLQLTEIFRQAKQSKIISYAHNINKGLLPQIQSPFKKPQLWRNKEDCLFIDSDEVTQEQLQFIGRIKKLFGEAYMDVRPVAQDEELFSFRTEEAITSSYEQDFVIPEKFRHVNLERLVKAQSEVEELREVVSKVHPWSSLHYGLTAVDSVIRLYTEWIPRYYGEDVEIQILSPMTRGSLGTVNLNKVIQQTANPEQKGKAQLLVGERIFRVGDRVIHRKNNYDLGVFNGDIGKIRAIDTSTLTLSVQFLPDAREVLYKKDDIVELDLAYAVTIHKSQGSEFEAVIIPVLTQHFKMLYKNLMYTALTRAKKLSVVVGTRKAMAMAVKQEDTAARQTLLAELLQKNRIT